MNEEVLRIKNCPLCGSKGRLNLTTFYYKFRIFRIEPYNE